MTKRLTHMVELARYEVLKMIQEGLSISEIAKARKVSRQAIYKVLATLNNKSMIRKKGYSIYELTEKGMEGLHSFVALRYKLRQHNLHFKIKVLESQKNWDLRRNEMRQFPYFNRTIKLKNNEQDLFNFGKIQVKTTTKSLIIKMPTLYAIDWEGAIIQAIQILEDSIIKLEKAFKVVLIKDYKSNITIISQEYARIQDALAKLYRKENNRVYLTGEDGKIWLITDFSFSTDELEFIHPEKATDDVDSIAPALNFLRRNPNALPDMVESIKGMISVQNMEASNILKHQSVLDEILITFRKINERLDKAGL